MIATEAGFELDSVQYHPNSETYRFEYDQNTTPPGMAVVAALSEVTDTDPTALEPIHASVDTDALHTLVEDRDGANGDVQVTWTHEEYTVTVHSYGVVAVAPSGEGRTIDPSEGVGYE